MIRFDNTFEIVTIIDMLIELVSKNYIQISMKSQNILTRFVNILSVKRYRENFFI